jgi:hypothetical protein
MTGGGLRAATLRRHARLLSVGEQHLHGGVGTDTVQRGQRGRRIGGRVLRTSLSRRPGSDFGDVVPLSCPAACLAVVFHDASSVDHAFTGSVTMRAIGRDTYQWHPHGMQGFPSPDGPPTTTSVPGGPGVTYTLPRGSVTVLRGAVS